MELNFDRLTGMYLKHIVVGYGICIQIKKFNFKGNICLIQILIMNNNWLSYFRMLRTNYRMKQWVLTTIFY